mgnify:CR=1 FL=1
MSQHDTNLTQTMVFLKKIHKSNNIVYLCQSKSSSNYYALKSYSFKNTRIDPAYINESRFICLSHNNVISILDKKPKNRSENDSEAYFSYILMELAPYGDFGTLLARSKLPDDPKLMRTYFHQFIDGLEYLHSNGVAHLDLKLSNLLLGEQYILKIADFDCARKEEDGPVLSRGTKNFRAPELIKGECYDKKACDIYSAGVILFCFTVGMLPYYEGRLINGHDLEELLRTNIDSFWNLHRGSEISDDFKTLFVSMVNPNPSQRPKIEDIKKNKWFQRSIYTDKELYSIMKRNNQIPCLIKRT